MHPARRLASLYRNHYNPPLVAAVAQSVEQRIRNAKVTSSIPVSGTIVSSKKPNLAVGLFAFLYLETGTVLTPELLTAQ